MTREKTRTIRSDEELEWISKNNQHNRKEGLKGAINNICLAVIYLLPTILILLYVLLIIHWIKIADYDSITRIAGYIISFGIGFVISHFKEHGINSEK